MPNKHDGSSLHLLFRALADPLRLRLLNLIADREICVCYLVEILRTSQPKISRHPAYLRRVGVVAARREGKWMHYKLIVPKDDAAAGALRDVLRRLREMPAMRRDVSRFDLGLLRAAKVRGAGLGAAAAGACRAANLGTHPDRLLPDSAFQASLEVLLG